MTKKGRNIIMTKDKNNTYKNHQLTNGGLLVPMDDAAQAEIERGDTYIKHKLHLESGSTLMFSGSLPNRTSIKGDSVVRLDKNSTIYDSIIDNSNIYLQRGKISHSEVDNSIIHDAKDHDSLIENYTVKNSEFDGKTNLVSTKHHIVSDVKAIGINAQNSTLDGGIYENADFRNSIVQQPGTTAIANSDLTDTIFINSEQANKDWDNDNSQSHFLDNCSIKDSTIINDKYHGVFLNTIQMKNAMLYNGIIADHSEISGPQQSNLRLLLDNLQFSNNTLDFKLDDKSVKVAGTSWYHKNTHTDSVYYTNLHNNKTFNDVNTVHSRNFKEAFLPQTLLENEQALHNLNEFDPNRPNASVKDSLMAIHNKAKEVGEELNNISNPSLNKSDDLEL